MSPKFGLQGLKREKICLSEIKPHFLDVRGFVHHSTVHKENPTSCNNASEFLLFRIYMKFSVFRATHRPSSGA
jgi:hypothetical protein